MLALVFSVFCLSVATYEAGFIPAILRHALS